MRVLGFAVLVAVLLAAGLVGIGYIGGGTSVIDRVSGYLTPASGAETPDAATGLLAQQEKTPLFYRDPMGLPEISAEPKKDSMGMDYIPVYPDADQGTGQILFYRNPMGELDVSPVPKKDSMDMDYIPVREQSPQDSCPAPPRPGPGGPRPYRA